MELRTIQRLVRIMQKGELTDLELDDTKSGFRLRLRRGAEMAPGTAPVVHVTQSGGSPAAAPPPAAVAAAGEAPGAAAGGPEGVPFTSPMVGTFYRSSSPDSDPFVEAGHSFGPETVLCIIEAMKVMNEIKAETSGTIVEVLVENGDPVEFGQPLFLVKPGG